MTVLKRTLVARSGNRFKLDRPLRENLWLRAGYLVLTGTRNSLLGQYRANDEVVFQARMTF